MKISVISTMAQLAMLLGFRENMPDGSDGSLLREAFIENPATGAMAPLSTTLNIARTWHTATVLPDGTILILGGIGNDGKVVTQAELFDPASQMFQVIVASPTPRAFHTVTVLTDGQVLVAGGVSAAGVTLGTVEVWNPRTKQSKVPQAPLTSP